MLRASILLVAAMGCQLVAANVASAQATLESDVGGTAAQLALGQRIYREGIDASGQPLKAIGAAQASLAGQDVACAKCHRRSGYGTSEGRFAIRPIIGPALRQEQTAAVQSVRGKARLGPSQRPPYSEALVARAIRNGIDAAGKPLDPAMPRYTLSDAEMKSLAAYLFSLSAQPSPGVDEHDIHFATVIQPGVAPRQRRAMLDVMQAFVRDKGGSARQEEQRRDAGNMRMARSFRKWVLHVWELSGPSETWDAQLEAFYSQQPVFALIGGLGDSELAPDPRVQRAAGNPERVSAGGPAGDRRCEQLQLLFFQGGRARGGGTGEIPARAGRLRQDRAGFRRDDAGATAAATFRMARGEGAALEDQGA